MRAAGCSWSGFFFTLFPAAFFFLSYRSTYVIHFFPVTGCFSDLVSGCFAVSEYVTTLGLAGDCFRAPSSFPDQVVTSVDNKKHIL